jgi:transposase
MSRFIQVSRHQQYLLPPSIDEWLPENHLARFIAEVIDQLDLGNSQKISSANFLQNTF